MKNVLFCAAVLLWQLAFAATPEVRNVKAVQPYPWNEVVLTYTVVGDTTVAASYSSEDVKLRISAIDKLTGKFYVADASALSGDTDASEGLHNVTWNLNKQGVEFNSDQIVFTVIYEYRPLYCVIDISKGANASSYPVTYLEEPPSGGFNVNAYKTTKIVLRRIEPGPIPRYTATITKPFYIGLFEVTQRQYELVTGSNPCSSTYYGRGNTYPVHYVSYATIRGAYDGSKWPSSSAVDATSFIGKLRAKSGITGFDLPTRAQWVYACLAGSTTSNLNGDYMWYDGNSGKTSHSVGTKQSNAWGLYDMQGNVYEWTLDRSGGEISGNDPIGPSSGSNRYVCGGSWYSGEYSCSPGSALSCDPSGETQISGFRIAIIVAE